MRPLVVGLTRPAAYQTTSNRCPNVLDIGARGSIRLRVIPSASVSSSHRFDTDCRNLLKVVSVLVEHMTPSRASHCDPRLTGTTQAKPCGAICEPKWISTSPGLSAGISTCAELR